MKNIILITVLLFSSLSYSIESCRQALNSESLNGQPQAPILTRHGDTYWGFYQCNSCDSRVSAKPNVHGDQACSSCGSPHTDEDYDPPALFRKGGELYLVDPGRLIRNESEQALADSGETQGCPFCGNSHFSIDEACIGCGAEVENPSEIRRWGRPGSATNPVAGMNTQPQNTTSYAATNTEPTSRGSRFGRRTLGLAAGAFLMVTTASGVIWGNQTYVTEGVVTDFNSTEVTVSYSDKSGDMETVVLGRPGNETQIWRQGETLDLYFINWSSTPRGAERLDGNVLTPIRN